jgi:hypothetical protein
MVQVAQPPIFWLVDMLLIFLNIYQIFFILRLYGWYCGFTCYFNHILQPFWKFRYHDYLILILLQILLILLDLQLYVQLVPITTEVVSSNHAHGEVYFIQLYVIKFVSDLRQVGDFLCVLWFPLPIKLTPRYSWNIIESGIKHHNPNP